MYEKNICEKQSHEKHQIKLESLRYEANQYFSKIERRPLIRGSSPMRLLVTKDTDCVLNEIYVYIIHTLGIY